LGAARFLIKVINRDEVTMPGRSTRLRPRQILVDVDGPDTPGVGVDEHAIDLASEDTPVLSEGDFEVQ
jgi:hypothetical protein